MKRGLLLGMVFVGAAVGAAIACGPFFPLEALDDRAGTMKVLPANSFRREIARLHPPPPAALKPVGQRTEDYEASTPEAAAIAAMRQAGSAAEAYARGASLPPSIRDYTAGAVAYHAHDDETARHHFEAVLRHADAPRRAAWALYMLGRLDAVALERASGPERCAVETAAARFTELRRQVAAGLPDPLGLAIASLGEEALLYLALATDEVDCPGRSVAQALERMTLLYAEQAAGGDPVGAESLRTVADRIFASPALLRAGVSQPTLRQLLILYALHQTAVRRMEVDVSTLLADPPDGGQVAFLIEQVMAQTGGTPLPEADRLAALLYQQGRFDMAEKLLPAARGPLAEWLRAKLALRRGDQPAAAAAYAAASQAFTTAPAGAYAPDMAAALYAERSVLALSQGEFVQAMRMMLQASPDYWTDAAYIAERILSTAELRAFVDAEVPAPNEPTAKPDSLDFTYFIDLDRASRLRYLLARRLVREEDFTTAQRYMPAMVRASWYDRQTETGRILSDYATARQLAADAWTDNGSARALFEAGRLARRHGMEIMGHELEPDGAIYGGSFPWSLPLERLEPSQWLSKAEVTRVRASEPARPWRYSYRFTAADLALQAAAKLPPRSQAYAAVLCHAARWVPARQDESEAYAALRRREIYAQYLKHGAYVPWGDKFGQNCPEPDFDGARFWTLRRAWAKVKSLL
ncbi:hypothetical protein [Ferrovibrio sp.]|uniref:hypothetical protein n=1 Tax=Ferrovibrio sp. TaxID=1917215 RepID=UPI003D29F2DC